jgi:hypothetical protein
LAAAVAVLAGCDSLLDVELPGTVTDDALESPRSAEVLVVSVIAQTECAYSRLVSGNAAGNEDVFIQWDEMDGAFQYQEIVGGGASCGSGGDDGYDWFDPFQKARYLGERFDEILSEFSDGDVNPFLSPSFASRQELLAVNAIYTAVPFAVLGEYLCEVAFDGGPLVTPAGALQRAEDWATLAIQRVEALPAGDMTVPYGIATSAREMAYGLRARIRWAQGDLPNADLDAQEVSQGFVAYVTRDGGLDADRENDVYVAHHEHNYVELAGPVDWWSPLLGRTNPVTSTAWADPIPFTGYIDLAIDDADGRAIDANQNAITVASATGTGVPDPRVPTRSGVAVASDTLAQPIYFGQGKYTEFFDPIPLVNWEEMWLIRAEADEANAVTLVNDIRNHYVLPNVTYAPTGGAVEDMILEERRRSLFLEGRFWSVKIRNGDKLWFPRGDGASDANPRGESLGGAVRMLMQEAEFQLNDNFTQAERNTQCDPNERPIYS